MIKIFFPNKKKTFPKKDIFQVKLNCNSYKILTLYKSLLFFLTVVVSNSSKANVHYQYYKYHKKNKPVLIGVDWGITRKSMLYSINNYKQKYQELGLRVYVEKEFNTYMSIDVSYFRSIDKIGKLMNGYSMKDNYYHTNHNSSLGISLNLNYPTKYKLSLHAKTGVGLMQYQYTLYTDGKTILNETQYKELITLGLKAKYPVLNFLSITSGGEYFLTGNHTSFLYTYFGLTHNISYRNVKNYIRKCPTW